MPDDGLKTTRHFDPNLPAVFVADDGALIVDSRDVAAHFAKRHNNVLATIDKKVSEIKLLKNKQTPLFRESKWIDPQNGETYRSYEMDEEAFSLIALGFTGPKALKWQLDYVHCFRRMHEERKTGARMSPDQVRLMIREEMAEAVRLMKGAVWGMTKGQKDHLDVRHARHDDDLNTIGVTALDTKEAIDRADLKSIGVILASRSIPTDRAFSNKCSISLRDFCSSRGLLTARSPETRAHVFPSAAVGPWMQAHGAVLVQARFEAVKAAAKVRAAAEKDARTGQTNLFPFPKPAG